METNTLEGWLKERKLPHGFEDRKLLWGMFDPSVDYWGLGDENEHRKQDEKLYTALREDEKTPRISIAREKLSKDEELHVSANISNTDDHSSITFIGGIDSVQSKSTPINQPFSLGKVNGPGICPVRMISGSGSGEIIRDSVAIISNSLDESDELVVDILSAPARPVAVFGREKLFQSIVNQPWESATKKFFHVLKANPHLLSEAADDILKKWLATNIVSISSTVTMCALIFSPLPGATVNCLMMGAANLSNFIFEAMKNLLTKKEFNDLEPLEKQALEKAFFTLDTSVGAGLGFTMGGKAKSLTSQFCKMAGGALPIAQSISVNTLPKQGKNKENHRAALSLFFQGMGKISTWVCFSREPRRIPPR